MTGKPISTSRRALQAARRPEAATGPGIQLLMREFQIGNSSIGRARALLKSGRQDLIDQVDSGQMSVDHAYHMAKAKPLPNSLLANSKRRKEPKPYAALPFDLELVGRWVENGASMTKEDPAVIIARYKEVGRPILEQHLQRVLHLVAGMLAAVKQTEQDK